MPEGDTIYRAVVVLRKALLDRPVTRFETTVPPVAAADARFPVAGRVIQAVEPRGKHLQLVFRLPDAPIEPIPSQRIGLDLLASDLVLHTHMRMTGAWHIYRPGEPWQKPARYARVVLHTEAFIAPCFSAPVVELLTAKDAARHPDLAALGPDVLTGDFDREEALSRLRSQPDAPIGVALLNQRAMAGVGNVYKSEVLFIRRVSPFSCVRDLSRETLAGLIEEARRLMRLNLGAGGRRTRFGFGEREPLWVYGRSGRPCRICGTTIRMQRQGTDGRSTYFCPRCQFAGESVSTAD